jgi:two-component system, cell cycle sensor histidine kinase and response regulator CckA
MLVDDNTGLLEIMREVLATISDAEMVCCHSGPEAIAALEAAPNSFELVITDFDMPQMDGVELCHRLHAMNPELPVVLLTGNTELSEADVTPHGLLALVRKPFSIDTFEAMLDAINSAARDGNVFAPARLSLEAA